MRKMSEMRNWACLRYGAAFITFRLLLPIPGVAWYGFWTMTTPITSHNPVARFAEAYWVQSRGPLASLVFIAPLLVVYETGVLVLGPEQVRNGADVWLRQLLDLVGFGQYFLLPSLTVCALLAWHYLTREPWQLSRGLMLGMAAECVALAICLRLILHVQGMLFPQWPAPLLVSLGPAVARAVGFLGAGIYEELLFRLMLLAPMTWILRRLHVKPATSCVAAVVVTSLLFSLAHHVGPGGYPVVWFDFVFRFFAGVFFSILFLYRGFGIAAGAHAGYDILVGVCR
ncbi:MAG: CPBP family intramembrane glutamic endopeptidase [Thermoguttaceae bacterium]|nr:CPBP family intramembrane glutamic endopeptidase [Thermoguttaceae bacterium]